MQTSYSSSTVVRSGKPAPQRIPLFWNVPINAKTHTRPRGMLVSPFPNTLLCAGAINPPEISQEEAAAVWGRLAVREERPAVPVNSISRRVYDEWDNDEGAKFNEKTRQLFGETSNEFFTATRVMASVQEAAVRGDGKGYPGQEVWAVPVRKLGEGTFGIVAAMDILTLDKRCAVKRIRKGVRFGLFEDRGARLFEPCAPS